MIVGSLIRSALAGVLAIPVLLLILSCASRHSGDATGEILYQTADFTPEHLFTSGIEGPAYVDGFLYAVNFDTQGTIGLIDDVGACSLFVRLPPGSIGNGIRVNRAGNLFIADYTNHNILQINRKSRKIEIYAHDESMNQPNDLAIRSDGVLFASDPNWGEGTGQLWRINPDGTTHLLESNMGTTNGIEVSTDEKHLYVNESVQRTVWKYDLDKEGNIDNKRKIHEFEDHGMDGMRCDAVGSLYITRHGKGTVAILNGDGKLIREVQLKGKKPSNIAFGGADGRLCFVTLQDRGCFEVFRSEYPGRSFNVYD